MEDYISKYTGIGVPSALEILRRQGILGNAGPAPQVGLVNSMQQAPPQMPSQVAPMGPGGPGGPQTGPGQGQGAPGESPWDRLFGISMQGPEADALRRQSMLSAGLSMMVANAHPGATTASAVAAGILSGRGTAADMEQAVYERRAKEAELARQAQIEAHRREVYASMDLADPAQRDEGMRRLLAAGDEAGAKGLLEYAKTFPDAKILTHGDNVVVLDPRTGRKVDTFKMPEIPAGIRTIDLGDRIEIRVDDQSAELLTTVYKGEAPGAARAALNAEFANANAAMTAYRQDTQHHHNVASQYRAFEEAYSQEGNQYSTATFRQALAAYGTAIGASGTPQERAVAGWEASGGMRADFQKYLGPKWSGDIPVSVADPVYALLRSTVGEREQELQQQRQVHIDRADEYEIRGRERLFANPYEIERKNALTTRARRHVGGS
jgi:hypothetical protein